MRLRKPLLRIALAVLGALSLASAPAEPPGTPASPAGRSEMRRRADELLSRGKAAEAAAAYADLITGDAADGASEAGRVRALIALDRWKDAIAEARRYASANPGSPEVRTALGEALYRGGQIDEADSVLAPLASAEPAQARALLTLALIRVARGKEDEAAPLFDKAVASAPDDRHVLFCAAGEARTRADAIALLTRYLAVSEGDDPDRIDGAKRTIPLYRTLGERPVWVPVETPEHLEIPLASLPGAEGRASGYVLDATFESGKRVRLLLDSGSTGLFLVDRVAKKGGVTPLAEGAFFAGGGEERHASQRGLLPSISFGDLRFRDALVTTTTQEIEPTGRYNGVLGLSVFQGYRATLDLVRGRLVLDSSAAEPVGMPYWTVAGQMLVEAEASADQRGLFVFDTGAARSHLATSFAESLPGAGVGGPAGVRAYGGEIQGARTVKGIRLKFEETEIPPTSTLTISDLTRRSRVGGVEISGHVGLDLLDGARILVDTRARRILATRPGK